MQRISLLLNVLSKQSINLPLFDNVNRPLNFGERKQDLWNDRCDYLQIDELNNINWVGHKMTVLQLNICGAVSKRSDFTSLLDNCKKTKYGYRYYTLMLNFLSDIKSVLFKIPNYNLISRPCKHKNGGGFAILVADEIKYQIWVDLILSNNKNFELIFIEIICKNQKNIIMGSLYRPLKNQKQNFLILIVNY